MGNKYNPIRIHSKIRNVLGKPLSKTANEALRDYLYLIGSQKLDLSQQELEYIAKCLKNWNPQSLNPFEKEENFKSLIIDRLVLANSSTLNLNNYRLIRKIRNFDTLQTLKVIHLIRNTEHFDSDRLT